MAKDLEYLFRCNKAQLPPDSGKNATFLRYKHCPWIFKNKSLLNFRMSNPNEIQDIKDGEIIEEQIVEEEPETMALYEVDVMNLVKQMDLQQRYFWWNFKNFNYFSDIGSTVKSGI